MSKLSTHPKAKHALPFLLYVLYMITAVRLCRYSSWMHEGTPNPFLPKGMKLALRKHEMSSLLEGRVSAFA